MKYYIKVGATLGKYPFLTVIRMPEQCQSLGNLFVKEQTAICMEVQEVASRNKMGSGKKVWLGK